MSTRFVSARKRPSVTRSLPLSILFACSASVHTWAQTSPDQNDLPTFRAGVHAVLVDVLVLNEDKQPVPALSVEDFTVLEDGVQQEVRTFSITDGMSYVGARDRRASGLESQAPPSSNRYPRTFIIIYNRQSLSFSELARAKIALESFVVESMTDADEAMVIDNGNTAKIIQQLSNSKELALESIRRLVPGPPLRQHRPGEIFQRLYELGETLRQIPGRKVAVLLSNEVMFHHPPQDIMSYVAGQRWNRSGDWLWLAIESLNRANTSVYTIDIRGPRRSDVRPGGLSALAVGTGGRHFQNSFAFESMLRAIGQENSRTYYLGYTSTNGATDGTYRTIEVHVDRPGVEVVARRGYFAKTKDDVVTVGTR